VGDRIEIEWMRGEVALHLSGVALHGARLGEALRVRVDGRNRPLTAIVDAAGHARIGPREAS
jgi:flagella basal body P-ring formation protein FlgA